MAIRVTERDIVREMTTIYRGANQPIDRLATRTVQYSNYGKIGSVFYSLNGSPPKCFAIAIVPNCVAFVRFTGEPVKRSKFEYVDLDLSHIPRTLELATEEGFPLSQVLDFREQGGSDV
jgi:hypothetical protein